MRKLLVLGALVSLGLTASPVEATVESGPIRKLGRGVANLFTGCLEVGVQVARTTEVSGSLAGMTLGVGKGVAAALQRTLVGVVEVVTFPIPSPGIGYNPLIRPEFITLRDTDRQ